MKHINIVKIFDSLLIHHEIHDFKLFIHLMVWFNIYKNEHNAKLVTLMIQGVKV
jgi:hypothetical protein